MSERKLISVVCAVFNEEENMVDCYNAVKGVLVNELSGYDHEIIVCDNASTDRTFDIVRELALKDPTLKVIRNSRNFGAARSAFNGLVHATGDAVVFAISADLQDPPSLIPQFVRKWEEGYDVVYGIRAKREERFLLTMARKIFYRVIEMGADFEIPPDVGDFYLIDKTAVASLHQMKDYYPYTRGLIPYCGFKRIGLEYTQLKRERGTAKGVPMLLVDMGLNGLVSVTRLPIRLCLVSGISVVAAGLLGLVICFGLMIAGLGGRSLWLGGFFLLCVLSGIQLSFLGLLGEYIGAIHSQVRSRPPVIERELINFDR
jgi:polyisoprenyl-phosphate glycosyltransferase